MTAITFAYVEDYIEYIAGYRDENNKTLGLFDTAPCPISLARYDVAIVDSLASQTAHMTKSYTDKQAALAVKIVDKYRRQLSNLTRPVIVPATLDNFRLQIRQIDRSKNISLNNQNIVIKFPYDTKLIDLVKHFKKNSEGSVEFNSNNKTWELALTESCVNWSVAIGRAYEFEISSEVLSYYDKILEVEQQGYEMKLVETATGYRITNAPDSLNSYINEFAGGFGHNNIVSLLDNAEVLGYTVDPVFYKKLPVSINEKTALLISQRYHMLKPKNSISIEDIMHYARQLNRLPVCIYETGLPKDSIDDILYLNTTKPVDVGYKPKLLVSSTSLMLGSKKQAWLTNAEKVIIIENDL